MSNVRKFTAVSTTSIVATEPPEWIRKMNDHYAKTGTVRPADAARFRGDQSASTQLVANARPSRNDDGGDGGGDE